jgi:aspartokinase-like uncharacterized kinase
MLAILYKDILHCVLSDCTQNDMMTQSSRMYVDKNRTEIILPYSFVRV